MFWSLILEPGKRYTSTVKESFHLSMATLDVKPSQKDNEVYPVKIEVGGNELLLCNLSKPQNLHANLDLVFQKGTDITFSTSGKATIHLTGYCIQDEESDNEGYSSLEEEEDESFSNFLKNSKDAGLKSAGNKKDSKVKNESKQASPNKRKLEPVEVVSKKKAKNVKNQDSDDDDDDSSVDEDELGKLVESINEEDVGTDSDDDEDDEDDDDEAEGEEEEDSDSEELDNELYDSDTDSDDENSEDETTQVQKPKKEEIKTPQQNKQNKTPVSNKKQDKQQGKNQLTNGVTPTSGKKDKKEKIQANQSNVTTPKQNNQKTPKKGKEENATPQSQKKQIVAGGVVVEELKQGDGPVAKPGKMVSVYYTGRLKQNNRVFDQSNQGPGFKFRLGNGEVIKGWDVGLSGMKVGSKRRVTIPPGMGYGNKGSPPQIPPNSTLVFDVELKSVN